MDSGTYQKPPRVYRSVSVDSPETKPLLSGTHVNRRASAWRQVSEESIQYPYQPSTKGMSPPPSTSGGAGEHVSPTRQSSVVTIGGSEFGDVAVSPLLYPHNDAPLNTHLYCGFAIWNTMMGTSILSMPWGVERAGLVVGSFLILLMGGLCLYTTYCNLRTHQQFGSVSGEISELARSLLGPYAEVISKIFSLVVLLGANIVYWILMTNFLYHSVTYVYELADSTPYAVMNSSGPIPTVLCPKLGINDENELMRENLVFRSVWNLKTVPIFLSFIIVPLLNFKSPTFFTKFNSFGTLSIVYLIVFVLIKVSVWGIRVDSVDPSSPAYSPLASVSFPATSGMLALSYFVHNIIITIMRNNSNQKNNGRDLSIAYGLVTLTYLLIGVMFYIAFPLLKSCIQDNLLDNFSGSDMLTVIARLFLLFQLVTVFPLIAYMLRVQTLIALTGRAYPATSYVLGHNLVLVIVCVLFAIFLPRIGTIIRFTGALSGLVHVFALPCVLRLAAQYKNGKVPPLSWIIHIVIPLFGAANLIAQFFVADD